MKLQSNTGSLMLAASQNSGPIKLFELKRKVKNIKVNPDDMSAVIAYKNGRAQKEEFYYGMSFLSQSARFITVNEDVSSIQITNSKGETRKLTF